MRNKITAIILLCLVVTSCSTDKLDVDVSAIELDLEFDRFEKSMFAGESPDEMRTVNADLIERGGELYEFYVYDMLRSGSVYDDSIGEYLWYFVSDSMMQLVNSDMETEFADFTQIEDQLTDAFKHLRYHLPDALVPNKIITYNSAFSFGVISSDSVIGVGLEMFLGPENSIVKEIRFPVYMKEKMRREYMPVDVAQSWLTANVVGDDRGETFLSSMIYFGKLMYTLEAMMPEFEEHLIVRYTKDEYDYARASEYSIWQYLVDMDWIYSVDMKVKLRFFEEAPTTVGIDDSPGRIGQFMGWQMVRSYMNANEDVTLEELLKETSETKILKAYKPKENE
ncbi:MAG: hypothetical protein GQ574_06935 [Crocinitomix sp.]|nr:hypothetical protein [Crocinitomix sp.]